MRHLLSSLPAVAQIVTGLVLSIFTALLWRATGQLASYTARMADAESKRTMLDYESRLTATWAVQSRHDQNSRYWLQPCLTILDRRGLPMKVESIQVRIGWPSQAQSERVVDYEEVLDEVVDPTRYTRQRLPDEPINYEPTVALRQGNNSFLTEVIYRDLASGALRGLIVVAHCWAEALPTGQNPQGIFGFGQELAHEHHVAEPDSAEPSRWQRWCDWNDRFRGDRL